MGLIQKDDVYRKYKYTVSEIKLLYDGEELSLPTERLVSINIDHQYESNLFPVFSITLVLESSVYYAIIANKDNIKFKLRIQKYFTSVGQNKKSVYKDFINDTFELILNDDDPDLNTALRKNTMNSNLKNILTTDMNSLVYTDNTCEFFLYKSTNIKSTKEIINTIISNATVTDGIGYIAKKAGFPKILMTPAHNTKSYTELIIPPLKAIDAVRFLDTYYGLHKTGTLYYMDFGKFYILSYDGKCTAYEKDEIQNVNIIIPVNPTDSSGNCGTLFRPSSTTDKYIVASNKTMYFSNETVGIGTLSGSNILSYSTITGKTATSTSDNSSKTSGYKIVNNITDNEWYTDIYINQVDAQSMVATIALADYDIDDLKVNKKFSVVFEDSELSRKYKGIYQLGSVTHTFTRQGNDFVLVSTVKLKKT